MPKTQTLEDGSTLAFVDTDTITITPPPTTVKISDLQNQLTILQEQLDQVGSNCDEQKAAPLAPIQTQIDALTAQLTTAQTFVSSASVEAASALQAS